MVLERKSIYGSQFEDKDGIFTPYYCTICKETTKVYGFIFHNPTICPNCKELKKKEAEKLLDEKAKEVKDQQLYDYLEELYFSEIDFLDLKHLAKFTEWESFKWLKYYFFKDYCKKNNIPEDEKNIIVKYHEIHDWAKKIIDTKIRERTWRVTKFAGFMWGSYKEAKRACVENRRG